jgi:hypothetical protein
MSTRSRKIIFLGIRALPVPEPLYFYYEIYKTLNSVSKHVDRLCGLVVSVPGYRSRGPGSIPGATRFPEK